MSWAQKIVNMSCGYLNAPDIDKLFSIPLCTFLICGLLLFFIILRFSLLHYFDLGHNYFPGPLWNVVVENFHSELHRTPLPSPDTPGCASILLVTQMFRVRFTLLRLLSCRKYSFLTAYICMPLHGLPYSSYKPLYIFNISM